MNLRILSYNVNGLRAAIAKGFTGWLSHEQPDILCLQEIKATPEQINQSDFEKLGYKLLWHPAKRAGYSGVAVFSKITPVKVKTGIGMDKYDAEGRLLQVEYPWFTLLCSYFPSGTMGDTRQDFKMQWLEDFLSFTSKMRQNVPNLIVSGDYNICHKPIDINYPEKHTTMSGFLPEEREWMDRFVKSGFVDSFRVFNRQPEQYSWWSYRANSREKNLGWRIDYHMVTPPLKPLLKGASILKEVMYSDHCPVAVEMDV